VVLPKMAGNSSVRKSLQNLISQRICAIKVLKKMIEHRDVNEKDSSVRLMTQKTYNYLLERREVINQEVKNVGKKRRGVGQRALMHDDAGTEHYQNSLRVELAMIGDLSSVNIIKPSEDISSVSLGAEVEVEHENGKKLKAFLLGPDDFNTLEDQNVISYNSPLGKAIMGKGVGDEVQIKVKANILKFKILNISKGNF